MKKGNKRRMALEGKERRWYSLDIDTTGHIKHDHYILTFFLRHVKKKRCHMARSV